MPDAPLAPEPFTSETASAALEDLRARLRATRWPDTPEDAGWAFGTDPGAHGADPVDAFDVVVPDMPGYGYSDRPTGQPLDAIAVAGLWAELMDVLGYARFGAAGGDIGSHVNRYLALDHPDRVVAVHRMDAGLPVFTGDPADLAPEERAWLEGATAWGATEGAYAAIPPAQHARRVEVPSGFSLFHGDIVRPPRAWLERTANVVRVTEPVRGGHFAPFEEPELYAEELRAFFRPYRAAATG